MPYAKGQSGNPKGRPKQTAEQKSQKEQFQRLLNAETPLVPFTFEPAGEIEVVHQGYRCFPVTEEELQAKDGKERFFMWGHVFPAGQWLPQLRHEALACGRNIELHVADKVVLLHKGFGG